MLEGRATAVGEVVERALVSSRGILFTATRDGGAIGVHLYEGENRASDFAASPEDFDGLLEALHERMEPQKQQGPAASQNGPSKA